MSNPDQHLTSIEEMAHAFEDEAGPVDLSNYALEDWLTLILFWGMAGCVFLQFFTRYVLNNSLAWTEEVAANLLVMVVFLGSIMCARMGRHIRVDILYHLIGERTGRILSMIVELLTLIFFIYMAMLLWRYAALVSNEKLITVNVPRAPVYYAVFAGFALMAVRTAQLIWKDMRGVKRMDDPNHTSGGI